MDIQHLVDRLEDLIDDGRHLFGTKYTMVDEERALELIDQMRISIPEEIEKAARVIAQRDRILAEAHEEAARIVQNHRMKAETMLDENATVRAAQMRADSIREQARQEATRITDEADSYVMTLLSQLEQQLVGDLNQVRNGITAIQQISHEPRDASVETEPVHVPQPVEAEREMVDAGYDNNEQYS